MDKTIVVWFSCGVASAIATKLTIEKYSGEYNIVVVNSPIKEEHPDNERFLKDVEKWLNIEIVRLHSEKYPNQSCVEVWKDRRYMSGIAGAPCTLELKKKPARKFEKEVNADHIVLGFTYDEMDRHEKFKKFERDNILPVLIDAKLTKVDCLKLVQEAGIKIPEIYNTGFPNANCIGCVKSTSPNYWQLVREKFPDVFEIRAKQSREIGCRLVVLKGKRIFLDELPEDFKRKKLRKTYIECGVFCEEK